MFAGRTGVTGSDRFSTGDWTMLSTGSPVLSSAVIAFDCRIIEVRSVASHNVFFGAVEAVRVGPTGPALVYHERAYKRGVQPDVPDSEARKISHSSRRRGIWPNSHRLQR